MSRLIEQLSEICRANVLGEKVVIAPSLAIGHQIGDAIAQSGTAWVNLRFESVRTLVDAVVGFDLANEGVRVLSRAQALALVEKACDRALPGDSYFAGLADRPGLHRALQRSLDDLRLAGAVLSEVDAASFEEPRKARDLALILSAYEEELKEGRFADRAAVLLRAIGKLEKGDASPWPAGTSWIVLDDVDLTSEEQRFLSLVSRGELKTLYDAVVPPVEQGRPLQLSMFSADATRRASITLVRAIGEENELRAAFRALLAGEHSFDSAEVIYSQQEPYLPLAYELAAELAVPCTFAEGIAASYTRPGLACLAFLEWIGGGWEARTLQEAVRGGALLLPELTNEAGETQRLSPTAFARIVRDARIGWGRARYLDRIDAWLFEKNLAQDDDEARLAQTTRELARGQAARQLCEELLRISDGVADGEEIEMTALATACSIFVKKLAAVRSEIDGMAQSGVRRMLAELAELPPSMVPRLEATERLKEAIRHLHVAASNPRPGHLHVTPMRAGGWSGRPRAFVVGLDDAKYPGSGLQDPILLDSERLAINELLGESRLQMRGEAPERITRRFGHLLDRLARCEQLFISFPMLDLIERRTLYPSSAILDVFRRSGQGEATYREAIAAAGDAAGFTDSTALSETEWWLSRLREETVDSRAVHAAYDWLASGAAAVAARESEALTKWDALIEAPREEVDPRFTGKVYSASQLEKMASCPIGYFFERHLRIEPVEELHRDPDVWLNAMENGSLFHNIAESFMKDVCRNGGQPQKNHRERLDEIAGEELKKWRVLVPPPNESAFEKRKQELSETLTVFLRGEVDCGTVRAKFFEAPFGYPEKEDDGIAMADPLVLNLGGGRSIKLRGKIDRVDFDEVSGRWNVWDYKTGGTFQYRAGERLARGTKIQHAIYAKAICAMLERQGIPATPGESGYYFPTPKGRALRQARACDEGELEAALNLLFDVVGRGFFPHPTVEACRYCDYADVTGDRERAAAQMGRKFAANRDHPAVKAWLALQEVR